MGVFYDTFIVPLLSSFGHAPPDPTFGRYLMPASELEVEFEAQPHIITRTRRVFFKNANTSSSTLHGYSKTHIEAPPSGSTPQKEYIEVEEGEDVRVTSGELERGRGRQWAYYKIYESNSPEAQNGKGRGSDIVFLHGMCDYGAKYNPHVEGVLQMGYRVIIPDLMSHGRSTGMHVYLDSPYELTEGVHAVLTDLAKLSDTPPRKTFLTGSSLGGWTSLTYALRYPSPPTPLAGLYLVAPLIGVAANSMPPYPVYLLGLTLSRIAGRYPLAAAVKGNVSDDPRVEAEFYADPRCYHGNLRISTGLSLLRGFNALLPEASKLSVPLRIVHGSHDRATDHKRSVEFHTKVVNEGRVKDATCEIYEGYEHVMLKVGVDAQDDEKRQVVLKDMNEWFAARA